MQQRRLPAFGEQAREGFRIHLGDRRGHAVDRIEDRKPGTVQPLAESAQERGDPRSLLKNLDGAEQVLERHRSLQMDDDPDRALGCGFRGKKIPLRRRDSGLRRSPCRSYNYDQ